MSEFTLSTPLCRAVLERYGENATQLAQLPDTEFQATAKEGGSRVRCVLIDRAHMIFEEYSHESSLAVPVEVVNFQVPVIDEALMMMISHDCALDPEEDRDLIIKMFEEFQQYAVATPMRGRYGVIGATDTTIWIDPREGEKPDLGLEKWTTNGEF